MYIISRRNMSYRIVQSHWLLPVTVGKLIGSYFIYRGTGESGIPSYSSRVDMGHGIPLP